MRSTTRRAVVSRPWLLSFQGKKVSEQVGGRVRSGRADPVAPGAGALADENGAPARDVSGLHRRRVERVHVAEVRDDACHIGIVECEGGHAGRGTGSDKSLEIAIDDG